MDIKNLTSFRENMCRTCMKRFHQKQSVKNNKIHSIYEVPSECQSNASFMEILQMLEPSIKITSEDNLPKILCSKCIAKLLNAYEFIETYKEVDKKFRKMLKLDMSSSNNCLERLEEEENTIEVLNAIDEETNTEEIKVDFEIEAVKNEITEEILVENEIDWTELEDEPLSEISEVYKHKDTSLIKSYNDSTSKPKVPKKQVSTDNMTKKKNSIISKRRSTKSPHNEMYPCNKCQRKLKSKLSLTKHQAMHNKKDKEEQDLKCNFCDMRFTDSSILKIHQRTHNVEKPFLCSECGKGFTLAGGLKQHSLRHLDKRMYSCSHCPKSFHTKTDLLCHNDTHKAKPKIHVCDMCGRGFHKPFLLKQHKRYHNNERPYACDFCDKCFVTSEKQRRHMRIHTGEKPYHCKYCERAFTQSNDCIKHLKQHLGDNVYQCDLCPLRFPLARDLRLHFACHKDDNDETRARNLEARAAEEKNLQIKFGESTGYPST